MREMSPMSPMGRAEVNSSRRKDCTCSEFHYSNLHLQSFSLHKMGVGETQFSDPKRPSCTLCHCAHGSCQILVAHETVCDENTSVLGVPSGEMPRTADVSLCFMMFHAFHSRIAPFFGLVHLGARTVADLMRNWATYHPEECVILSYIMTFLL